MSRFKFSAIKYVSGDILEYQDIITAVDVDSAYEIAESYFPPENGYFVTLIWEENNEIY